LGIQTKKAQQGGVKTIQAYIAGLKASGGSTNKNYLKNKTTNRSGLNNEILTLVTWKELKRGLEGVQKRPAQGH
jgi:hypothetical protein